MSKAKRREIIIRDIDRSSSDYRIICERCKRDFGGTVAPIAQHNIRYFVCPACQFGSVENQMRAIKARLNADL